MKKSILGLTVGLVIGLTGISVVSADEGKTEPTVDTSRCSLRTDLSADMVVKCTEAMAKGDKTMLEGCCQEDASESQSSPKS